MSNMQNSGSSAGVSGPASTGPDEGPRPPAEAPELTQIVEVLQGYLDGLNASPPDFDVPWMLHNFRHACPEARTAKITGKPVSTALECKERYVKLVAVSGEFSETTGDRWAIVFREGRCALCGATGRSLRGHVVNTAARPPLEGRVAR